MLSHYDNLESSRFRQQVEDAHIAVLKDFKAEQLMKLLVKKIKDLDVPEWVCTDTIYYDYKWLMRKINYDLKKRNRKV